MEAATATIIDNLSIDWMRFIVHVLLALIFGAPVAIVVVAARFAAAPGRRRAPRRVPGWLAAAVPGLRQLAEGRVREGGAVLAAVALALETWAAVRFLGALMVVTLILMIWGVLGYGFAGAAPPAPAIAAGARRSERRALILLLVGVAASAGLFVGYKNRPGAYQGSPSSYMDPNEKSSGFRLDRIAVPTQPGTRPSNPEGVGAALTGYARAFERLLAGYYILDRNYNYDFHNRLFLRNTPLLPDYRAVGPRLVADAAQIRAEADTAFQAARPSVPAGDPLAALLDDVRAYSDYTFARSQVLARMTVGFLQTEAGLQHATHIYEWEGKMLGVQLDGVLRKHAAVLSAPPVLPVASEFVTISRAVHDKYANRIIGF